MRRRLYLRLYFAFLGVLFAIGLVSAGIHLVTDGGRFAWMRAGPRVAMHLSRLLPPPEDPFALAAAVENLHDELGVDVSVFSPQGALIASGGVPILLGDSKAFERARRIPGWVGRGVVGGPLSGARGVVLARLPVPESRPFPWRPILVLCGALLVSLALVYPLSRSITRPLEQLTSAVEAYGKGNLRIRSGVHESQDEVGSLARAFDEMADRIQATRKAEKELLANVSHELRTPLSRVRVAMALIDSPAPAVQKRLDVVAEELDELERLISDVLTASKLDLSVLPLRRVHLRVAELVEKSRQRALAFEQPVSATVEEGLSLEGDEALLSRAIDNLLDNARKYADGKPVEISARREGDGAVVAVRDRGPGIPPEDLAHVFDPFFRGSAARGQASGFGLGLALARRVAEAHGGTIRAENAEGGGARIELRLPG